MQPCKTAQISYLQIGPLQGEKCRRVFEQGCAFLQRAESCAGLGPPEMPTVPRMGLRQVPGWSQTSNPAWLIAAEPWDAPSRPRSRG